MNKCLVCGSSQKKYFDYKNFTYYKCQKCKLVSTYPIPNKKTIENHYADNFITGNYKFLRKYSKQYEKIYQGFLDEIKNYYHKENKEIKNLKLLDIGCFTGEFMILADKAGFDVFGIELQKEAAKIANKKLPGKIKAEDIENDPFKNKFDIVTMFGLVEHVEKPDVLIKNVSKVLKKEGVIAIQTPNSGTILEKILQKYWPPYSPVEHIHLFNEKSITKLLKKNDLEIIRFKKHFKMLPIAYVYNMLNIFGPEFKKLADKIPFINLNNTKISLPFYIGEMFLIAKKK